MIDTATLAAAIGTGIASLLTGLRIGAKRGRNQAIEEGDPTIFSKSWMERAERSFKKVHDDATVITEHEFRITSLESEQKKLEVSYNIQAVELTKEIRLLNNAVNAFREDIASLRGELGFERRRKHEEEK